jgi:hypothetical protein
LAQGQKAEDAGMISAAKKAGAKWPTVAQMQAHIAGLIEKQNLIYSLVPIRAAQASYELEEVWIPPIKSSGSYAAALHEIGHICGRHRASRYRMVRERDAWSWAKAHALIWTAAMERHHVASLAWYEARIKIGSVSQVCSAKVR